MGGVLCKQRSRSRPPLSAHSRRKKLQRVDCVRRAPCLLCFIVHGQHPATEAPSPDLPADTDRARLLLLCPGELSAHQESHLNGGPVRSPGLAPCPATGEDMVCKRKNCGDSQQTLTPCKQPRCAPNTEPQREDLSPHNEDLPSRHEDRSPCHEELSPCHEDLTSHSSHEDLSPHHKQLSPCHEDPRPHNEDLSPHPRHEDPSPLHEDPSPHHLTSHSSHEDLSPHLKDLSSCHEDPSPHNKDLSSRRENLLLPPQSLCPRGDITHSKGQSSCTGEETVPPQSRDRSSCLVGGSAHLKPGDLSLCPSKETEHPLTGDMLCSSGDLTHSFVVLASSSADKRSLNFQRKCPLIGDPALACMEERAPPLPRNNLQHSVEEQCPLLSGDLSTPVMEEQEPHCSGVKTLQSRGEGHIPADSVRSCTGEDACQTARDPAMLCTVLHCKPVNEELLQLVEEDLGQPSCCINNLSSCSMMCLDHTPSSLVSPGHVAFPSPSCNQTSPSQSPTVEGEVLVLCEPLHINQLPPSLLLKIFSLLSLNERCLSASLVCKYWRELCLDFQFWKQLDLSSRQQVKDNLLEKIASRCLNITEINISDCLNVTDAGICKLGMNCSSLIKYTAYRCKQLSDPSLISLATHCPSLQKVHVGNQDRLTDEALHQLGSRCKDMRDIHFGQCYKISDEGMMVIAKGCPKLQKIYMQENKLVTNRSVEAFAEHCPELQYVGFMGCSVTSQGVIHLTRLKNLSSLDLRNITELDNQTVVEIVKKCQNLTSLNLCLNRNIDDRCVEVIAKEGRSLKELYLVTCKITDHALIAIGRSSSTIETVDVGWCKEITDQGATLIAQSSKSIRYLGLMRCDQVNETTVEQLVKQYPHITFSTVLQDCKRTLERAYQMGWTPNASSVS